MSNRWSVLIRASVWALVSAVSGTVLWILLVATAAPLVAGEPFRHMAGWWSSRAIAAFYFGGFVAGIAIIPHALLFAVWLMMMGRYPALERRIGAPSISSFLLALPLVIAVFVSFAAPSFGLGPFWSEAFAALPWVLLSTWGGILGARWLIKFRDKSHQPVAA